MEHKVLVIEDDVEINELLGEYLALEHIEYLSATEGKAGLEIAQREKPDAIILDLMLPDIDGYQICRQLTANRETACIPVIMLTALNQACNQQQGVAAGCFRYMNKPFFPDELLARVRDAFEWKKELMAKPPCGQMEVSSANPSGALHGINDMIAAIFARSTLPESNVATVREAFLILMDWALDWGAKHNQNPHLLIDFRLTTEVAGQLPGACQPATAVEWSISELQPAILAQTLFVPQASNPLSIVAGDATAANPAEANPLAPWYQFLAKTGISSLEKDTKLSRVHLRRVLKATAGDAPMPVVTIDGTRMPTRLRQEAVAGRRK